MPPGRAGAPDSAGAEDRPARPPEGQRPHLPSLQGMRPAPGGSGHGPTHGRSRDVRSLKTHARQNSCHRQIAILAHRLEIRAKWPVFKGFRGRAGTKSPPRPHKKEPLEGGWKNRPPNSLAFKALEGVGSELP